MFITLFGNFKSMNRYVNSLRNCICDLNPDKYLLENVYRLKLLK